MSLTLNKICPIVLTEGAVAELKSIINSESETKPLRIGVKNGGCAGFSYILNFEDAGLCIHHLYIVFLQLLSGFQDPLDLAESYCLLSGFRLQIRFVVDF